MREWLRSIDWLSINTSALILLVVLQVMSAVPPPKHEPQSQTAHQGADHDGGLSYPWWQYSGAWTAIFTIVLTGSTIGLWIVTGKSANVAADAAIAAKVSADRLLRVDRPFMFSTEFIVKSQGLVVTPLGYGMIYDCVFRNLGTRPAIARLLALTYALDALPEALPVVIEDVDFDWGLIEPGQALHRQMPMGIEIPKEVATAINSGARQLFVHGFIRYSDMHGIARLSGFAYEYVSLQKAVDGNTFVKCGPLQYWYDVEESADS